jgi:hypothetical protein
MNHLIATVILLAACLPALAQPARSPASSILLEHFHKSIVAWDKGPTGASGASPLIEHEFLQVRSQLRDLGTAAQPLASKIAEQMLASQKNKYVLGYMLMDLTPSTPDTELQEAMSQAESGDSNTQLVAIARLGKGMSQNAIAPLTKGLASQDLTRRLMSTIAIGFAGKHAPESAARALALHLKDPERSIRSASANGLRLLGAQSVVVTAELIDYLRSRENISVATAALKELPTDAIMPAKAELEAIVADPKFTQFIKQPAVDLLVRIEQAR